MDTAIEKPPRCPSERPPFVSERKPAAREGSALAVATELEETLDVTVAIEVRSVLATNPLLAASLTRVRKRLVSGRSDQAPSRALSPPSDRPLVHRATNAAEPSRLRRSPPDSRVCASALLRPIRLKAEGRARRPHRNQRAPTRIGASGFEAALTGDHALRPPGGDVLAFDSARQSNLSSGALELVQPSSSISSKTERAGP